MPSYTLSLFYQKIRTAIRFHYYRKKNGWIFPKNMAHTSGVGMADGTYEPELTQLVSAEIGEGATVIDVGANVGYFARLFAELVREDGKVIAFEPEAKNYISLYKNTLKYCQVVPVAMAVSNTNSLSNLQLSSHASCHSLFQTGNYQLAESSRVLTMKLDSLWELYLDKCHIDCIKIDVEGAEIAVLEGMQKMLNEDAVSLMILEFCPQIMINAGYNPMELYNHVYASCCVSVAEEKYKKAVGDEAISTVAQFEKLKNYLLERGTFLKCNLLCKHK